ncbi:MFS transporter [Streptomyces sp. NPDC002812]|uniref:MFS transporter n=1 Tax=Streptomyces sp. NPDC002812 TaxID=3154434 RepID=UPI0033224581
MSGIRPSNGLLLFSGRLRFFLISAFLLPLGSFMLLPFAVLFLHERLGLGLGLVGLVIGVASLVQFSGGMVGALISERIGLRSTMLLGLTVRSVGFALFLTSFVLPGTALVGLLLAAAGDALYTPANKAYVVLEAPREQRPLALSCINSAQNVGMALGPLIASVFILRSPLPVFCVVTAVFVAMTVAHACLLPADKPAAADATARRGVLVKALVKPPILAAAAGMYVYMFFQNYLAVFLADQQLMGSYGFVLLVNTVLIIVLQPLGASRIERLRLGPALVLSFGCFGVGLIMVGHAGLIGVFAGVVAVSLGELVLFLKCDLAALDALPDRPAAAVGTVRMAEGLGSLASGVAGGQLYLIAGEGGSSSGFWVITGAQGIAMAALAGLGMLVASRRGVGGRARRAAVPQSAVPQNAAPQSAAPQSAESAGESAPGKSEVSSQL